MAAMALATLVLLAAATAASASQAGPYEPFDAGRALHDVAYLADIVGPRVKGGDSYRAAAVYVADQLEALGLDVNRQSFWAWSSGIQYSGLNIIADRPAREQVIVICAHLDSVAVSPGANDNASGIAVMLELARITSASGHPFGLRFIAFDGEEPNRDGSAYYLSQLADVERSAIGLVVNIDMVGAGGRLQVGATDSTLADRALRVATESGIEVVLAGESPGGDFAKFQRAGVPALTFLRDDRRFHTPHDRLEFIVSEYMRAVGDLILAVLDDMIAAPARHPLRGNGSGVACEGSRCL